MTRPLSTPAHVSFIPALLDCQKWLFVPQLALSSIDCTQAQLNHNLAPALREGRARDVLVLLKDYKLLFVTSSAGGISTLPDIMHDEAFEGQLCVNRIALGKYHGCERIQIPRSMQLATCGGWTHSSQVVANVQKRSRTAFHCDHVGDFSFSNVIIVKISRMNHEKHCRFDFAHHQSIE
jgi:hypothetical protein